MKECDCMILTVKKLLIATIVFFLLDITYLWVRNNHGLVSWVSPTTIKFWAKDIALLVLWVIYFVEKKKK